MKFPLTTHGGLQFRVLLLAHNWVQPPEITHRLDTRIGLGRTTIEERRPGRSIWLLSQRIFCTLFDADADDWNKGIAALGSGRVAVPLWVDARPVADWGTRIYDPQKVINFDADTGDFEIYDGSSLPGSPAYPLYAPLILGYFTQRPPADAELQDGADVELEISEASPYGWRVGVQTQGSGWTALPNRLAPVRAVSELEYERLYLSSAREPGLDGTNAAARWLQEGDFTFDGRLAIREALTVFAAKRGAWGTLSDLPAWFQPGAPTAATPDSYTARFASDTLRLSFPSLDLAESRIGFLQEIATPGREQAQPGEEFLYLLEYEHDPANPELFTGWDAPLALPEGEFAPQQIGHQELAPSLNPQDARAEIDLTYEPGSLAADWMGARLFGDVRVKVWKCDPDDPVDSRGDPLFTGYLVDVDPDGNLLRLTATAFGRLLDPEVKAPGWSFGARCNATVFSPPCGLDPDDHDSAGTIAAADIAADGVTLTVHSATGWGGPAYPDNWFAAGSVSTGSGRAKQIATVLSSTTSSGNLVLKLNRRFWPDLLTGTQAATLLPGCDRQKSTCIAKFDNYAPASGKGYRGCPFVPAYIETRSAGSPKAKK